MMLRLPLCERVLRRFEKINIAVGTQQVRANAVAELQSPTGGIMAQVYLDPATRKENDDVVGVRSTCLRGLYLDTITSFTLTPKDVLNVTLAPSSLTPTIQLRIHHFLPTSIQVLDMIEICMENVRLVDWDSDDDGSNVCTSANLCERGSEGTQAVRNQIANALYFHFNLDELGRCCQYFFPFPILARFAKQTTYLRTAYHPPQC